LHGAKSGTSISRTDSLLDRLIVNTVSTGAVTAISAGIDLALFVKYTQVNYHFALCVLPPFLMKPGLTMPIPFKVHMSWENCAPTLHYLWCRPLNTCDLSRYSNSFMATLNSRRSQAQISDNPESFGMRIQVSQQTQQTGGTKIASQENTTGNWETVREADLRAFSTTSHFVYFLDDGLDSCRR
jgi:hypothetical protein